MTGFTRWKTTHPLCVEPTAMKSFSQFGEDALVWEHFGRKPDGFFVEVGANHPTELSNTWFLEQRGWSGVLIEPLTEKCALLREARKASQVFQVAIGAAEDRGLVELKIPSDDVCAMVKVPKRKNMVAIKTETVRLATLDDILAEAGNPRIDFVSIDVEGMEMDVLRSFDLERHRPGLVMLEDHLTNLDLIEHLPPRGYKMVRRTGINNWFIPGDAPFRVTNLPCSCSEPFRRPAAAFSVLPAVRDGAGRRPRGRRNPSRTCGARRQPAGCEAARLPAAQ